MSALDLFASAMGAFILIAIILMPFYLKQDPVPVEPQDCPVVVPPEPQQCPELPEPEVIKVPVPMDKLLVIEMNWFKDVDIDLHVVTPDGTFNYENKAIPGRPGRLVADQQHDADESTPGVEIWITHEPTPGNYEICFDYFRSNSQTGRTEVLGKLHKPSGTYDIPSVSLPGEGARECPLQMRISEDFQVEIL
jgi:hypothetical protein